MNVVVKVATLLAGIWAAMHPAVYGALSIVSVDSSAIIDLLVVGSCVVLVGHMFKPLPRLIQLTSFLILLVATSVGFFHPFRELNESGPLPCEWLNGCYPGLCPKVNKKGIGNLATI